MIAVIDYNSGNIASVVNALRFLNVSYIVTADPKIIAKADGVIFPGQGRAKQAMSALKACSLILAIKNIRVPFLGICLGLQLLSEFSQEDNVTGLRIISGVVKKFPPDLKLPQIGWNRVRIKRATPLTSGIANNSYFYFVHSYYLAINKSNNILAAANYGIDFPAIIRKKNFYATQFHPEKSGIVGLKLLKNFCDLCY